MFSLALLFVLVFFSSFSIVITSLREDRAGLCASRAFVCLFCFFFSSWCQGLVTACDVALPGRFY